MNWSCVPSNFRTKVRRYVNLNAFPFKRDVVCSPVLYCTLGTFPSETGKYKVDSKSKGMGVVLRYIF